jgi:hypothetical protein
MTYQDCIEDDSCDSIFDNPLLALTVINASYDPNSPCYGQAFGSNFDPSYACLSSLYPALFPPEQYQQLECDFISAVTQPGSIHTVTVPGGFTGPAFSVAVGLNFAADGGTGTYSWSVRQTISQTGTVTYADGYVLIPPVGTFNDRLTVNELQPNGSTAFFYDVPGFWTACPATETPSPRH